MSYKKLQRYVTEFVTEFDEVKTEKGQALTPSALTGVRVAIHRHLTFAPLRRTINILQVCQQNVWSEGRAVYKRKQCKIKKKTNKQKNKNKNKKNNLFGKKLNCRNWINTSWKGRTRTALWKMQRSKLSLFGLVVFLFCSPRKRL